jgi:hypothetical protein
MLDLIALTVGLLGFIGWSALMLFGGYAARRRAERHEQQRRISRLIEDARRKANAPDKMEPRYPVPSAEARKRAQA